MATSSIDWVIQHLRKAALLREGAELTDGQLLEGFVSRREAAALELLVQRHGPMVWGVCRRIVQDHHDAEDAFQATFLVLVRRAAAIMPRQMVANWLYGVAHQTALKARATRAKRQARERQVTSMPEPEAVKRQDLWPALQHLLDEELSRLPDKYRVAIVLCDLEGKTRREAAGQLGLPDGTLAAQLARARTMLAKRLARHGQAVSGGMLAAVLSQKAASAAAPASVMSSTIKAVTSVAAGQAAATGQVSAKVVALTEGVLRTMLLTKLKVTTAVLLVLGIAFCGIGSLTYTATAQQGQAVKPSAEDAKVQALPNPSTQVLAVPEADKFEDLVQFNYGGGIVSGTGIKDKGGFTVVTLEAVPTAPTSTKLSVSFAVKEDEQRTASDFRVIAVDAKGKQKEADVENKASAGGNGVTIITLVSEFSLSSDKIDSLVVQQAVKPPAEDAKVQVPPKDDVSARTLPDLKVGVRVIFGTHSKEKFGWNYLNDNKTPVVVRVKGNWVLLKGIEPQGFTGVGECWINFETVAWYMVVPK